MSTKANIIIIEDERNICSFISRVLEPEGYRVITAATGREGLQHITSDHPDLILLDLGLPDMDGLKHNSYYRYFRPHHGNQQGRGPGYGR